LNFVGKKLLKGLNINIFSQFYCVNFTIFKNVYFIFQSEWFGSCIFDHLHSEDVEKVREQLSTQEPQNTGRILDLKTGTVKKEGHQCKFYCK